MTTHPLTWDEIRDLAWLHMLDSDETGLCLGCGEPWPCDGARTASMHVRARRRLYGDEREGRP